MAERHLWRSTAYRIGMAAGQITMKIHDVTKIGTCAVDPPGRK